MIGVEVCLSENEDTPQRWYFRVRAVNGEIVAQSESYTTKAAAEKGIRALRRALLPGTRDAEAMAKAWDEGANFANDLHHTQTELAEANPYRKEVPRG